jgi:hypothetical protein
MSSGVSWEVGEACEGPCGPILLARSDGLGQPNESNQLIVLAGGGEPLFHGDELGRIKCLDEGMEGFSGGASGVAVATDEDFSTQPRVGAL